MCRTWTVPPPARASSTVAGMALRLCSDWSTASSSFSSIEHLQEVDGQLAYAPGGPNPLPGSDDKAWDNRDPGHYHAPVGRVAQLARARRLQRQTGAVFLSGGDQQEQPFVQVSPEYSRSSK